VSEKKDLTALSELQSEDPTTETQAGDAFAVTEGSGSSSALEGLDGEGLDDLGDLEGLSLTPENPNPSGDSGIELSLDSSDSSAFELGSDSSFDSPMAPMELSEDSTKEFLDPLAGLAPVDPEIEALAESEEKTAQTLRPDFSDLEPESPKPTSSTHSPALSSSSTPAFSPEEASSFEAPSPEGKAPTQGLSFGESQTSALSHEEYSPSDARHAPTTSLEERFPAASASHRGNRARTSERSGVDGIRDYSDHVAPTATTIDHPFSLLIDGMLREHEREALLQILSRENLNIREVELEPQFQAGKILIPRISEYAGVLIAQALRNSNARMRLGPSDRIFASRNAEENDSEALIIPPRADSELLITEDGAHPSDRVILSPDANLADRQIIEAIDTLHSSMNLKAAHVAQPQSPAFQDALERLKRQLKLQAHHRGANALLSFKYELLPLEGQTIYKLVVQAKAVKV
jgi:hypothetical protein